MDDTGSRLNDLLERIRVAELAELRRHGIGMTHTKAMLDIIGDPGPDQININIKTVCNRPKGRRPDFCRLIFAS